MDGPLWRLGNNKTGLRKALNIYGGHVTVYCADVVVEATVENHIVHFSDGALLRTVLIITQPRKRRCFKAASQQSVRVFFREFHT